MLSSEFRRAARPWFLAAVLLAAGCEKSAGVGPDAGMPGDPMDAGAIACTVKAPTVCPDPVPHYGDISPIVGQRCTPCHNGDDPDGPWPLITYRHVADWADIVRDDVLRCTMPPADGGVAMSDDERVALLTWILCGFPE